MNYISLLRRVASAGALLVGLGAAQEAKAATFTVTNTNDSGVGSLRQAVLDANSAPGDDSVAFDSQAFASAQTIALTSGPITVASSSRLTIVGPSASTLSLSGNDASGIFQAGDAGLELSALTLKQAKGSAIRVINGYLSLTNCTFTNNNGVNGAAIDNSFAELTISGCTFTSNRVQNGVGGAIRSVGRGKLTNTTFSFNSVQTPSGSEDFPGGGGAISVQGSLDLTNCSFFSNSSVGGYGGAIHTIGGAMTIISSAFINNSAANGGAIGNIIGSVSLVKDTFTFNQCGLPSEPGKGGGAVFNNGFVVASSCSLYANQGYPSGGAVYSENPARGQALLSISDCTAVSNYSNAGKGIFNSSGTFTLYNSLIGSNYGQTSDVSGVVASGDYNLVQDAQGVTLPGSHNIVGQDPQVGGANNFGGRVYVVTLRAGSPAIDAGNSGINTDQRGGTRPLDIAGVPNAEGGNGSDIGAFEYDAPQSGPDFVVNAIGDNDDTTCSPSDCSLREAINAANANPDDSTITFDPAVFGSKKTSIVRTGQQFDLTTNISIIGPTTPGSGVTIINDTANFYMMEVKGKAVSIANVTFGTSPTYGSRADLLFNGRTDSRATLTNCTFAGSHIDNNYTNLTLNNCTLVGNNRGNQDYALIHWGGSTTLNSCTVTGNSRGITIMNYETVNLANSLVVGNSNANIYNERGTLNSDHSITTGTAADAGLDPAGLNSNGGFTPTVALLRQSPAINAGATSLTTDQRGQPRDRKPDIGAYEFPNNFPFVVSLEPQNVSDKVGAKRTFTLTVSDADGASDIKEAWLLINERLSWNAGAILIYVPSATSPTNGLLYLRKGDAFLPPMQIGEGAVAGATLDNGVVRVAASEVKVTTEDNNLTLSLPLTIRDGLVGINRLFGRVVDKAEATDPTSKEGDDGYIRFGTYTVTPQFSGGANSAPVLSRLTPSAVTTTLNSSGIAPATQTFSFAVKDENGSGDLESLWFLAGKERNWTRSATFIYQPRSRRLYLRSDDGNSFLGGSVIGTPGILENSQVRVDLSQVKTTIYPDGKTVGLSLPLQAKRGLLGQNKVWLRAQDNQGATAPSGDAQGYVLSGTWNVAQAASLNSANSLSAGNS